MSRESTELMPGTLDLLVLQSLTLGANHGYGLVRMIQQTTDGVLTIEEGSLYPALHRMESRGWVASEWRASEHNRRARYYRLTRAGRRHLANRVSAWQRMVRATQSVLSLSGGPS